MKEAGVDEKRIRTGAIVEGEVEITEDADPHEDDPADLEEGPEDGPEGTP